jgi:ATP-dependent exoDNAse (exonuclease V) beta subunit
MSVNSILSQYNAHPRDPFITFYEPTHKYTILTDPHSQYTSVTTWNHSHFPHFDADDIIDKMMKNNKWREGHKYWGLTKEQIKKQWSDNAASVSGAGTDMHFAIECFMNNEDLPYPFYHKDLLEYEMEDNIATTKEWEYFLDFLRDYQDFKPYRTEWMIYDEDLKLSGSIDMVYENPDGSLNIYDWKRAKEITRSNNFNKFALTKSISTMPDTNFWHYALQLNTYKAILERKYSKQIRDLYLVRLHPNAESYELICLPDLSQQIRFLFEERMRELQIKS